jgi:hypothetical protein
VALLMNPSDSESNDDLSLTSSDDIVENISTNKNFCIMSSNILFNIKKYLQSNNAEILTECWNRNLVYYLRDKVDKDI